MAQQPNRRRLRFHTLDQVVGDAMNVGAGPYERLGSWSLGMCCDHLAAFMEYSIDGFPFRMSPAVRLFGVLLKARVLDPDRGLPAGVKFPRTARPALEPSAISDEAGLAKLAAAVDRLRDETTRAKSPLLGTLTREQWDQLHCNHAALHLSYLLPIERDEPASNATRAEGSAPAV